MLLKIKYAALFLAFQAHFSPRLCPIGFRSGYLDLAVFLGVPTFLVDYKSSGLNGRPLSESLCKSTGKGGRMLKASGSLNTLIRIEFEREENAQDDTKAKTKKDAKSMIKREPGNTVDTRLSEAL